MQIIFDQEYSSKQYQDHTPTQLTITQKDTHLEIVILQQEPIKQKLQFDLKSTDAVKLLKTLNALFSTSTTLSL
jgi:hypothetical protein